MARSFEAFIDVGACLPVSTKSLLAEAHVGSVCVGAVGFGVTRVVHAFVHVHAGDSVAAVAVVAHARVASGQVGARGVVVAR